MSEEKGTQEILDETIDAVDDVFEKFKQITAVIKAAKEELTKLERDKDTLNAEKTGLVNEKKTLEREKKGLEIATRSLATAKTELEDETKHLESEKAELEAEKKQLEKDKAERDEKIAGLTDEQVRLLAEYEALKIELQKFASAAAEAEDDEYSFDRIKSLLSIYTVLIEKIFQGQPHYRILLTLHGDKEVMTREELKNATGIGGAFVLRAVQELDKVELVSYDINNNTAKLKKRLFPKEKLG